MKVAVVIPTIDGREPDLARCAQAYTRTSPLGGELALYVEHDHPSCGAAWLAGAEKAQADGFDYIHFTADDLEPHPDWLPVAVETVDKGHIPAPLVFHPTGELESAGLLGFGQYTDSYADWQLIDGTTVPFLTAEMWEAIVMAPSFAQTMGRTHYCTDLMVSVAGRRSGWETVIRTGMRFTHHTAPAGRNYGRSPDDTREFLHWIEMVC